MLKKSYPIQTVTLEKIVGGGQAMATLDDGRKLFCWGGLPDELVKVQITKSKSKLAEGLVVEVLEPSKERVEPVDKESYISTSPWQIMDFNAEIKYKKQLIKDAFELHKIVLKNDIELYSDDNQFSYRNKMEFSWYWNKETDQLDLAFFKRGSKGKIPVEDSAIAKNIINIKAAQIRDLLRQKSVSGFMLKTLLIRCDSDDNVVAQLYIKDLDFPKFSDSEIKSLDLQGFEIIFSNPQSPASVITKKLQTLGNNKLTDRILGVDFSYTADSFFQINLPVYEQALKDMRRFVDIKKPTVDLYSGVGTIGLTIGGDGVTLVEVNESAVNEMKNNIKSNNAKAVLSSTEKVLGYITKNANIIVDPPRAGLHSDVIDKILKELPSRIIYLSCNPTTQARDFSLLSQNYKIIFHKGYNFFPKTPHIENLIVLELTDKIN